VGRSVFQAPIVVEFGWCQLYDSVAMNLTDPARERQRLREEYSRMMDGELEQLAVNEIELTELAKGALKEEMALRGLLQQTHDAKATESGLSSVNTLREPATLIDDSTSEDGLCVVRRFATFPEALIAKSLLESAGIASSLPDENVLGGNSMLTNALGGVRLFVQRSDVNEATKLLNGPIPNEIEVPGVGKYVQPRCPQCFSLDITFGELNEAAKAGLSPGIPLPIRPNEWLCHQCGCRWTDSEQE
jgi:hypothetical protein